MVTDKVKTKGIVTAIHGAVIDVKFLDDLPKIHNSLVVQSKDRVILEVFEHLPDHTARCLAMGSSTGLSVDLEVKDTGDGLAVPVGTELLGRIVNVFGNAVDGGPEIKATQFVN